MHLHASYLYRFSYISHRYLICSTFPIYAHIMCKLAFILAVYVKNFTGRWNILLVCRRVVEWKYGTWYETNINKRLCDLKERGSKNLVDRNKTIFNIIGILCLIIITAVLCSLSMSFRNQKNDLLICTDCNGNSFT